MEHFDSSALGSFPLSTELVEHCMDNDESPAFAVRKVTTMAVVGLTEQLMLRRVREDTPHYVRCREQLETFVEAMAANDQEQGLWNEEFESDEEDDDVLGPGKRKRAAQGRIQRSNECRLPLYRHWSLMDAMVHSPELLARLRTFKEGGPGRQVLAYVLAQMGIPIQQAQLQFSQMKMQLKSEEVTDGLLEMLADWAKASSSNHARSVTLRFGSFVVEFASHLTLSAADHVHILWAHLTTGTQSCSNLQNTFWEAYKALDVRSDRATAGLQLAKAQLRQLLQDVAMVDPGTGHSDALLSHGAIGPGLCLDLSTRDSWSSASPLVHPIALTRLGLILQDADGADPRSNGSQWLLAPMLCIGPPDAGGACMAVALPAERRAKKHPDTGRLVYSCHNGFLNVFGAPRGLLRAAVEESQVHTAKTDYHNSATLSVGRYDVAVLTDQLEFEWEQRERLVWAPDDAAALQADL